MSTTLNKITTRAKAIRRSHPAMKWTSAIKQASAELRKSGAIGAKVGKVKKQVKRKRIGKAAPGKVRRIARRTARRVSKRVGKTVIVNKIGKLSGVSAASLKSELLTRLKDQLGKLYVRYYMTQSISETNKLSKQIAEVKRKIKRA